MGCLSIQEPNLSIFTVFDNAIGFTDERYSKDSAGDNINSEPMRTDDDGRQENTKSGFDEKGENGLAEQTQPPQASVRGDSAVESVSQGDSN